MAASIKIALDLEGGDLGPDAVGPAVNSFLKKHKDVSLILLGEAPAIAKCKSKSPIEFQKNIQWIECEDSVLMDEPPGEAIRKKKRSSMQMGINLVKEGHASAFVSSGNTGALVLMSKITLRMIPGIDRPALVNMLPGKEHPFLMLDLGANVDCDHNNLYQFAQMGSFLASDLFNMDRPRVHLLNNGTEYLKGKERIKKASEMLEDSNLNYLGYIEAHDIFSGKTEVVVCDGFSGNIALKAIEGTADLIKTFMRDGFNRNLFSKVSGLLAAPTLKNIKNRLDSRKYNGAIFIGLNGIVVKSHGGSDSVAFESAIEIALSEAKNNIVDKIKKSLG
jgi:phosphate acyltransferase